MINQPSTTAGSLAAGLLRARPDPIPGFYDQTRPNRVPFDIIDNFIQFPPIPNPQVKILARPKFPRSSQDPIRPHRCVSPQPGHNLAQLPTRLQHNIDVGPHDQPSNQLIRLPNSVPIHQSLGHYPRDPRLRQPHGSRRQSCCRRLSLPIHQKLRRLNRWTPSQTPSHKHDRIFRDPMGQTPSPEHKNIVASPKPSSLRGAAWAS
ncbi:MAG: hypothetical protein JWO80_1308 [Bryobacterales bacterium]|nr:hypothetical protein [Bryobacterales bacterium]